MNADGEKTKGNNLVKRRGARKRAGLGRKKLSLRVGKVVCPKGNMRAEEAGDANRKM